MDSLPYALYFKEPERLPTKNHQTIAKEESSSALFGTKIVPAKEPSQNQHHLLTRKNLSAAFPSRKVSFFRASAPRSLWSWDALL